MHKFNKLGSDPSNDDPTYLNSVMRADMRKRYVIADAGMIGCNYAVADSVSEGSPAFPASPLTQFIRLRHNTVYFPYLSSRTRTGDTRGLARQRTFRPSRTALLITVLWPFRYCRHRSRPHHRRTKTGLPYGPALLKPNPIDKTASDAAHQEVEH